jgi:hypothetical protein
MNFNFFKAVFIFQFVFLLGACAANLGPDPYDSSKNDLASATPPDLQETEPQAASSTSTKTVILNQQMSLWVLKANVLELLINIPLGAQIEFPEKYDLRYFDYRNSAGVVERSSTGFIHPVQLVSVLPVNSNQFTSSEIQTINNVDGGLYISASIASSIEGINGTFPVLPSREPGTGFLKYYEENGKPKFNLTAALSRRFGLSLNRGVDPSSLNSEVRTKWIKIFAELVKVADRTRESSKSLLMMDLVLAKKWSTAFEQQGLISPSGAWTIAVQATAVRHGFANVPCAEFQSEILRQAYQRAGYRITVDFNSIRGNELIWSNTAAVVNFSSALWKAGWIPWDASKFRPVVGSFLMNGSGLSPGHTYISAGTNGRLIVDNGAPQGRDLGATTDKTISMMFQTGVFFLPPGINPPQW